MKHKKTPPTMRLSGDAWQCVEEWSALLGWPESKTASWFIIRSSLVLATKATAERVKQELDAAVTLNKVRLVNAARERNARKALSAARKQ